VVSNPSVIDLNVIPARVAASMGVIKVCKTLGVVFGRSWGGKKLDADNYIRCTTAPLNCHKKKS
jgi:hypothetical protein